MPTRTRAIDEALRIWGRTWVEITDDLREARLRLGLSQLQVARAIGVAASKVSRVESRRIKAVAVEYLVAHAAAVGLRASLKLYPVGGALRDVAQARYISRFIERIGHLWRVRLDVPITLPGDLRAIDVLLEGSCKVAVEVVTRLRDLQALLRAAQLKQRDIGATRLIIVVAGSHSNRRALAEVRHTVLASFELDTRRTLARLADGLDPGRDAIIVLD